MWATDRTAPPNPPAGILYNPLGGRISEIVIPLNRSKTVAISRSAGSGGGLPLPQPPRLVSEIFTLEDRRERQVLETNENSKLACGFLYTPSWITPLDADDG
jgi:hypothetical protein